MVKNPPASAEDVRHVAQSLGGEDAMEEAIVPPSTVFAGSCKALDNTEHLSTTAILKF